MLVRVTSVRGRPGKDGHEYIYVGRKMPRQGLAGHPLGNPFRAPDGCAKYVAWLAANPDRDRLLRDLAEQVKKTGLPLACWCGEWDGVSEDHPSCHAVVLAKAISALVS